MTAKRAFFVALTTAVLAAGCEVQPPVAVPKLRVTEDRQFNAVWDAAVEVLRDYRFTVDRADRRAGVITTFPLLTRHWFEFWRKDAVTANDRLEATLQTVYRQAAVTIRRRDSAKDADLPQGKYVVEVAVRTTRSNRPTLQVTGTADVYDLFLRPGMLGRAYSLEDVEGPGATAERSDLGRDKTLERILQEQIHRLAAKKLTLYAP